MMQLSWTLLILVSLTAPPQPSLREAADDYLRALCPTLARGASESDLERVLSFCTDDVVYEHPIFGLKVEGKERIREGMRSHVADYVGTRDESGVVVLSRIVSKDAVAVQVRETFFVEQDGKRERIQRDKLRILEFREGRIRRVLDY